MKEEKSRVVYQAEEIKNFRELIARTVKNYPDQIAYKYKVRKSKEEVEYINKTYSQFKMDIEALATKLLDLDLKGKKVAVISNNRYEWCTTYLAVTTGGMIIVPLDKALPENELESLIMRSGAEAIVCEEKYLDSVLKMQNSNLKYIISMDDTKEESVLSYEELRVEGRKLRKEGNRKYEEIEINPNEMSILLFTSGTTNRYTTFLFTYSPYF